MQLIDGNNKPSGLLIGLMLILTAIPIFWALGTLPIQLWDESRLSINAIEMSQNHQWMIPSFHHEPDMWNTKPPLLICLQAIFIQIMGISTWAIRLPVALGVFATVIFLFFKIGKISQNYLFSFLVVLVLVTSESYITTHVARTGDYDGLLILFTTLFCLSYYSFLETGKAKYLYLFYLFLWLGVMTKSAEGLLFLPGLFLFTLLDKKLLQTLQCKHFYLGLILFLLLTASYYLTRELNNPGYLKTVYENELGGRFLHTIENHKVPFYYYFEFRGYYFWLAPLVIGIILSFRIKPQPLKRPVVFALLMAFSFLAVLSFSHTKLPWYVAPALPFLAIVVSYPLWTGFHYLKQKSAPQSKIPTIALTIIMIAAFTQILFREINTIHKSKISSQTNLSWYLKGMISGKNTLPVSYVVINGYQPQVDFYILKAQQNGITIQQQFVNSVKEGDVVLVQQGPDCQIIQQKFYTEIPYQKNNVCVLYIKSKKQP